MVRIILKAIIQSIQFIVTGGKFGSGLQDEKVYRFGKRQEQKRKDFEKYGGRNCKICGIRIPANKYYCYPCYIKYVKK